MNETRKPPPSIDDLREYIDAFRTSSNRSRFAIYVVLIATALIAITTRNGHPGGWSLARLDAWYSTPEVRSRFFHGDSIRLNVAREEYLKQFAARTIMTSSPIPGVSIDINDLGVAGGIALVALMGVLVACLNREHENLYLALYKVRLLCREEGEAHTRGDSRANLLYHGLAMSQVLSSPPTLARWERGRFSHYGFFFFLPLFVYLWLVWNNWVTRDVGAAYGVNIMASLVWQGVFALVLLGLSATAWSYSRVIAQRWRRAFDRVNPTRRLVPQMPLSEWLKLGWTRRRRAGDEDGLRAGVASELVDTLRRAPPELRNTIEIQERVPIHKTVSRANVREMTDAIFQNGRLEAEEWCSQHRVGTFRGLVQFTPVRNEVDGAEWCVWGTWEFAYVPSRKAPAAASA